MPDTSPSTLEYHIFDPETQEIRVVVVPRPRRRYWLHAVLFLATIFTTLCIGARLQDNFNHNLPAFSDQVSDSVDYWPWSWALTDWHRLLLGIPFSLSLLGILTAHELGHFILCLRRGVYATLPFFIPAPTLIGTMGAFIRIRSPIRSRADLFDIGIAGPIAGFVVAVPVLLLGMMLSKPLTVSALQSDVNFGLPLIFSLGHWLLSSLGGLGVDPPSLSGLALSPVAMAAWAGMFATALNLIPGGQLDGGHIIFALKPSLHRRITMLTILVLLPLSWYLWAGWLLWAVVLRLTGSRHPEVPLQTGLDRKRWWLGAFALLMFILTVTPSPIKDRDGKDNSLRYMLDELRQQRMHPSEQR
jgi:membrane-associated protease RseP (regulator of RpoE activity)